MQPNKRAKAREPSYHVLLDALPIKVWTATPSGELEYANRQLLDFLGCSFEALAASGWQQFIHPEDLPLAQERWAKALGAGEDYRVEFRLRRADGRYLRHLARAAAQRDAGGSVVRWLGTSTDVEAQRVTEEQALRLGLEEAAKSEAEAERVRLYELFMQAPVTIAVTRGPDHVYELANPLYCQMLGVSEPVGKPVRELLPELEGQGLLALLDGVYRSGEPFTANEFLAKIDRGDGRLEDRFFRFTLQPVRNHDGVVTGLMSVAVEVTDQVEARRRAEELAAALQLERERLEDEVAERKRAEEALRSSHEQVNDILESISDAFYALDDAWRFTYINSRAEELWGKRREDLLGMNHWEAFPQAVNTKPHRELTRAFQERRPVHFETLSPVIGTWIEVNAYPTSKGISVYFRDITGRRQAEEAQKERELEQVLAEQRRRIGQELHDGIRQELVGIGMLSNALQKKLEARQIPEASLMAEFTKLVADTNMQVRRLIHGLVPVSIEADALLPALERASSNLEQWYGLPCRIHAKGAVRLRDAETANHLFHIVQEAMTNAARHSRGSQIDVFVTAEGRSLTLSVLDDGSGLPDETGRGGMGLKTMAHRAQLIGAELRLAAGERGGTTVTCVLKDA